VTQIVERDQFLQKRRIIVRIEGGIIADFGNAEHAVDQVGHRRHFFHDLGISHQDSTHEGGGAGKHQGCGKNDAQSCL